MNYKGIGESVINNARSIVKVYGECSKLNKHYDIQLDILAELVNENLTARESVDVGIGLDGVEWWVSFFEIYDEEKDNGQ